MMMFGYSMLVLFSGRSTSDDQLGCKVDNFFIHMDTSNRVVSSYCTKRQAVWGMVDLDEGSGKLSRHGLTN